MKTEIGLRMEMIGRVVLLAKERGFANLASFLEGRFAELEALAEELRITAGRQSGAHRAFRQEAVRRGAASAALHEWMADVALVARSLPAGQAPGAAERFRMPRSQSYQAQQATAKAFIKALRELQETFAERGLDEEAIAQAEALLEQIEQANGAKNSRYLRRIESTAKLMLTSRRALAVVREIDAILQRKLRATPALLAEWNFARHVHRPWKKSSAKSSPSSPPPPQAQPLVAVNPAQPRCEGNEREMPMSAQNPAPASVVQEAANPAGSA